MDDPHAPAPVEPPPQRTATDLRHAASKVEQIVAAAEQAAEDLRAGAEQRALERIAEADRAAAMRVRAADDEAEQVRAEVAHEADALRAAAAETADAARHKAQVAARQIIAEARAAAREVLRDGEQVSANLRDLSDALRVNAERLLRDIRQAHAEFTSRLDRVEPRAPASGAKRGSAAGPAESLDVPEFMPRS